MYIFIRENMPEASPLLDQIINSGKFSLVDHYFYNYDYDHENNVESIFEVQRAVNDGTVQGFNGTPDIWTTNPYTPALPTCCGMYQPSMDLVNAFKVDEKGLPLLGINGPKFNETNLKNDMGLGPKDTFIPPTDPVDPRLDWTVARRGIPFMDWEFAQDGHAINQMEDHLNSKKGCTLNP